MLLGPRLRTLFQNPKVEPIRSTQNALVRTVRAVLAGREAGLALLEGDRLLDEALAQGLRPRAVLVSEEREERLAELVAAGVEARAVENSLLARLSSHESSQGILTLIEPPPFRRLEEFPSSPASLVLVIAGIQDPGNLGGLARSAEAAGVQAMLLDRRGSSPWNPKALRGSMGSLLRLPVVPYDDPSSLSARLASGGWRQVLARTRGAPAHTSFDWDGPIALWVTDEKGRILGEAPGLSDAFSATSIPMAPGVESLNVMVAASILLFAAGRTQERDL